MKLHRVAGLLIAVQMLCAASALAQGDYKAEAVGVPNPADLPKALQDVLQSTGVRLVDGRGAAVCELWLRKSIPTRQDAAGSADVLYEGLGMGTLIGVVEFPKGGSDFRGQSIKSGFYTLRYALIPQDGNHMGVSPYRDFLLLGPVAQDKDIDKQLSFEEAVKLGRQASGTGHPAVLSLGPPAGANSFPAAFKDDQGHWLVIVKASGKSAGGEQEFPLAIVLVGKAEA